MIVFYLTLIVAVVFAAGVIRRVRRLRQADDEYFATLPDQVWTDEALAMVRNPDAADGLTNPGTTAGRADHWSPRREADR